MVLDGQTSIHLSGTYVGAVGWAPTGGVISQSGQSTTTVAELFAPPPLPPPRTGWYVWIVVLATYCLCWAGIGVASWPGTATDADSRTTAIAAPATLAAPGLIALVLVVIGLIRRLRTDRLRREVDPYVAAIYQHAWYCARCAGVFHLPGTVPAHVPTDALIPVAAFRATVWPEPATEVGRPTRARRLIARDARDLLAPHLIRAPRAVNLVNVNATRAEPDGVANRGTGTLWAAGR